jgi:hypothetical protein
VKHEVQRDCCPERKDRPGIRYVKVGIGTRRKTYLKNRRWYSWQKIRPLRKRETGK